MITSITETTDIAALPPTDRAMIVLGSTKTEADLKQMAADAKHITEVKDKDGREQAHRMGMKLRSARTTITKTGKSARDDATAFCKAVIDGEKRLIAITEAEENRVLGLRDAYDAAIEAEKAAKAAKLAEIQGKIDGIRGLPLALAGCTTEEILAEGNALSLFVPTEEEFGELLQVCMDAKAECSEALILLYTRVSEQEKAAAQVKAEAERLAQAEREAAAKLAAEREALAAEKAAFEAEKAAFEAQRLAAAAPVVESSGAEIEPIDEVIDAPLPVEMFADELDPAPSEEVTPEPVADWRVRRFALATAEQFRAMAGKVEQCGFAAFAEELRAVGLKLHHGAHDSAIAAADQEALRAADNLMLDATVDAIDAFGEEEKVAA